jgi:hypothetical protein
VRRRSRWALSLAVDVGLSFGELSFEPGAVVRGGSAAVWVGSEGVGVVVDAVEGAPGGDGLDERVGGELFSKLIGPGAFEVGGDEVGEVGVDLAGPVSGGAGFGGCGGEAEVGAWAGVGAGEVVDAVVEDGGGVDGIGHRAHLVRLGEEGGHVTVGVFEAAELGLEGGPAVSVEDLCGVGFADGCLDDL